MYVKELSIQNFKGIENSHLTFRPGCNLLIGENGRGKTSLLEAIAIGISGYLSGVHGGGIHPRNFQSEEGRTTYIQQGDGAYEPVRSWPRIELTVEIDGTSYTWDRVKENYDAQTKTRPRDICHLAARMTGDHDAILPVICYQSAGRVWSRKRKKQGDTFARKKISRSTGYIDCMSDGSSMKLMLEWCARMEQIAWQTDKPVREYEAVKQAVATAMTELEGADVAIFYDKRSEELLYQKGSTVMPISALSAGYQSLIWMIFDIAYRMAVLNPSLATHITDTPGLVLIDELDVHLHPRWQWHVIDTLRQTFPKIQIIATTHSPIIIASAKDVWCIDIEDLASPKAAMSGYGLEVDDILRRIQNSADLPAPVAAQLKQFYDAVDQEDFIAAKETVAKLEHDIGRDSPLAVKARERLELELALTEG